MKILYATPGVGVCGGVRVIWQHCIELTKRGHEVVYGVDEGVEEMPWLLGRIPVVNSHAVVDHPWDVVVATGFQTWPFVEQSFPKAAAKWGFIQMKESLFLPEHESKTADLRLFLSGFRIITISQWLKEYLEDECGHRDVAVIPNGVDTGIFYPDPIPELRDRPKPIALIVGHQLNRAKNISDAAKAIRAAGDFELWHVSPHQLHPHERVGQDKLFVMPSQNELRRIYSTVDLLVMSSRFEGRSCIPAEAMACKCPVVAMDHWGIEDLQGGRALIAEAENLEHLTFCVRWCMDHPGETASRVGAAYNYALAELRWDMVGRSLEELYFSPAPKWVSRTIPEAHYEDEMVEVKVISRFQHLETREYHNPGKTMRLRSDLAERYVKARCVEIV